jgi:NADH:ubiquinone oxidoreductase subunit H
MLELLSEQLTWVNFAIFCAVAVATLVFILVWVMLEIYFERKVLGYMQFRIGPNRVGPFGLLQSAADVFKLLIKEDTIPRKAERYLFVLAPILTFIPSFTIMAVLPFAEGWLHADINVGLFVIASVSELNRTPFDLPEAESELVAGYHVEYSGFRFAFYMLAEYVYVFVFSALITILFLGGWNAPFPQLDFIPGVIWFIIKVCFVIFFLFWIRATLPRVRLDQLMGLGWKVLLPLSLLNIFITAAFMGIKSWILGG